MRAPRVRLPDGKVRLVEPERVGRLDGFTLLFEALAAADLSDVTAVAIDETSSRRRLP